MPTMTTPLIDSGNLKIVIDVQLPESLMTMDKKLERKLKGATKKIALEGKSFWKAEAGRKLKSSRKAYQDGIDFQVVDDDSFYLTLDGFLPFSVENGNKGFDMKPGFLKNALPWPPKKRKFPRAVAATLAPKSAITKYRIIPLNVNRYVNMTSPKVFRMVTDQSPSSSWIHPGWKGVKLVDTVINELTTSIVPKHLSKILDEAL